MRRHAIHEQCIVGFVWGVSIKGIEMMKIKKDYESPTLSLRRIELESGFCGASAEVTNPNKDNGRIEEHSINAGFGGDFSGSEWDTDPTTTK